MSNPTRTPGSLTHSDGFTHGRDDKQQDIVPALFYFRDGHLTDNNLDTVPYWAQDYALGYVHGQGVSTR